MFKQSLSAEVIQALRGENSKSWLSQRIGYKFNQVYLWESHRRTFYWSDFENLCYCLNRPLDASMDQFFYTKGETCIHTILVRALSGYKNKDVAEKLGVTPSKLSRWLNKVSDIPFFQVCNILSFSQLQFYEFLDEVVGREKLHSIQEMTQQIRRAKKSISSSPYIAALAPALGLKSYRHLKKHKSEVLAKHLGITVKEVDRGIQILLESGQIYKEDGIYKLKSYQVNISNDKAMMIKNCQYWSEQVAKLKKKPGMKSLLGYRVFGVDREGYEQLREAQLAYHEAISKIIKTQDGPFDHIVAINFHTMVLEEQMND